MELITSETHSWMIKRRHCLLTYDVHENCSIFKTLSHPPCLATSKILPSPRPWKSNFRRTLYFSPYSLSPKDNHSIKRKHNAWMAIMCYQAFPLCWLLLLVSTYWYCLAFHWLLFNRLKLISSPEQFKKIKNLFFTFFL